MKTHLLVAFIIGLLVPQLFFVVPSNVFAKSEIETLRNEIDQRSNRLVEIEAEIEKYESDLKKVGTEKKTLQSAINQLELEKKKITAEISRTSTLITSTDLEINKLVLEISKTEDDIQTSEGVIGSIIRSEYMASEESLIELFLKHDKLSDFWTSYESLENVRNDLAEKVFELSELKETLETQKNENQEKHDELSTLRKQYTGQNQVLTNNQNEQAELLKATKSQELSYQQLLTQKEASKDKIIAEMRDFESKLQFILDPNTIPAFGTQVFNWPLTNIIITQFFGGTEFAAQHKSVYGGKAYHPGVDFGASIGTPIYAPLSGTVRATGNTDAVPGCYSWGKWTLIDHPNGLSTLYGHQSVISVSPGDKVSTGDIIGYVGNTGYTTGPHLHFTVYVKSAVTVRRFNEIKTVTSCGAATTPVAATEAYIDPMLYLPKY